MESHGLFKFADLFAGLGGFHVALERLGGEAVFAAEWDATLNTLYERNHGLRPWSDVNELDSDETIRREIPDHDILTAGFPCQPFSKSGSRRGFSDSAQGQLFFVVHRILRVKRPAMFILENVPNILRHDGGRTGKVILDMLRELGYDIRVEILSPHEFGVPQTRKRAYFVGSLDGLDDYEWPARSRQPTSITDCLTEDAEPPRAILDTTDRAIDMWGDFLARSPADVRLPSFPIWAMEFGATYPFEDETPPGIWQRRPAGGLRGMGYRGSFGAPLDTMTIPEQREHIPSHARRDGDVEFPRWKRKFIRQNREFHGQNRAWIDPWLRQWRPWELPSSFQKMEWNAQGARRVIDDFIIQTRASGIRIRRPVTAPTLVAFTRDHIPILGANLAGKRRYMTPRECANLQSLGGIALPENATDAYRALGNAVNATVVEAVTAPLVASFAARCGSGR